MQSRRDSGTLSDILIEHQRIKIWHSQLKIYFSYCVQALYEGYYKASTSKHITIYYTGSTLGWVSNNYVISEGPLRFSDTCEQIQVRKTTAAQLIFELDVCTRRITFEYQKKQRAHHPQPVVHPNAATTENIRRTSFNMDAIANPETARALVSQMSLENNIVKLVPTNNSDLLVVPRFTHNEAKWITERSRPGRRMIFRYQHHSKGTLVKYNIQSEQWTVVLAFDALVEDHGGQAKIIDALYDAKRNALYLLLMQIDRSDPHAVDCPHRVLAVDLETNRTQCLVSRLSFDGQGLSMLFINEIDLLIFQEHEPVSDEKSTVWRYYEMFNLITREHQVAAYRQANFKESKSGKSKITFSKYGYSAVRDSIIGWKFGVADYDTTEAHELQLTLSSTTATDSETAWQKVNWCKPCAHPYYENSGLMTDDGRYLIVVGLADSSEENESGYKNEIAVIDLLHESSRLSNVRIRNTGQSTEHGAIMGCPRRSLLLTHGFIRLNQKAMPDTLIRFIVELVTIEMLVMLGRDKGKDKNKLIVGKARNTTYRTNEEGVRVFCLDVSEILQ